MKSLNTEWRYGFPKSVTSNYPQISLRTTYIHTYQRIQNSTLFAMRPLALFIYLSVCLSVHLSITQDEKMRSNPE